jgi:hypothetical protein
LSSTILVNGQAFIITKALEWFLRHEASLGIAPQRRVAFYFVWPICADPDQVDFRNPGNLATYKRIHHILLPFISHVVDMCITVTELGEQELAADLKESERHFMRGLKLEPTPSGPAGPNIPLPSHPRFEFIRESELPFDIRYPPLDRFTDEIRVLYILPHERDPTTPIRCQMAHIPLGNVESESGGYETYKALSYVWGSTEDKIPILVNGREFQITQNLHAALLQLRRASNLKTIWADAICINQDDKLEKSR